MVQAGFLDGSEPEWRPRVGARVVLADWMTAPDNPYFARAAVNRVWAQFFGTGLVDPVDDLGAENPPSHPELLDALARQFAAHGYDFKFLIRAIVASRAYELCERRRLAGPEDPRLFARMPVRGLTPLQLYDSLVQAAGLRRDPEPAAVRPRRRLAPPGIPREVRQPGREADRAPDVDPPGADPDERPADGAGDQPRAGGHPAGRRRVACFLDTPGKIEALYLAALTRRPRPEELDRLVPYVDRGGPAGDPKQALADVFWALLNSAEFSLIH